MFINHSAPSLPAPPARWFLTKGARMNNISTKMKLALFGAVLVGLITGLAATPIRSAVITHSFLDSSPVGATTPSTGAFTTLKDTGVVSAPCTGTDGTGLLVSVPCITSVQDQDWTSSALCSLANSTDSGCSGSISLPVAYADASYTVECMPTTSNGTFVSMSGQTSKASSSFPYVLTCTFNCGAASSAATTADCHSHHN